MKRAYRLLLMAVVGFILGLGSNPGYADLLTDPLDAALTGGQVITFDGLVGGMVSGPLVVNGVTFTGDNGLEIGTVNYYTNITSPYLSNGYFNNFYSGTLRFDFSEQIHAVGFWLGSTNNDWLFTAYDANGTVLDTQTFTAAGGSSEVFYGVAVNNSYIDYAIMTPVQGGVQDYIFLDNFMLGPADPAPPAPVPEPVSFILFGSGIAVVAGSRAKRKNKKRGFKRIA